MLSIYIKSAFRALKRHKLDSVLNVLGLAVAISSATIIFTWSTKELGYDRFHSKHDRIFRIAGEVTTDAETFDQAVTCPPMAKALVEEFPEVESAVRLDMNDCIVRRNSIQFQEQEVLFTDPEFFELFDYELLVGDATSALLQPHSVVLTESIARKYFGSENPLGQQITMYIFDPGGNGVPYTVTGIAEDPPQNGHFSFRILGSFSTFESGWPELSSSWFRNRYYTYLLLHPEAIPSELESKLPDFAQKYMGEVMNQLQMFYKFSLQPLADIHLQSKLRYEIAPTGDLNNVYIFITIGVFILLLACINYLNLSVGRSFARSRDSGVKRMLGAKKSTLVAQYLAESTLVAVLALLLGLILIELLQSPIEQISGIQIRDIYTPQVLGGVASLTVLLGILAGLYPALFFASLDTTRSLRGSFKSTQAGVFIRKLLVVVQFTIAIILIIGVGVVNSQLSFVQERKLGFDQQALLTLKVNGFSEVREGLEGFRNELLTHSAISGVSASRGLIVGGLSNTYLETVDATGKPLSTSTFLHRADADFIELYDIDLLAGRNFVAGDSQDVYLVNATAVERFGWGNAENALSKPFTTGGGNSGRIIGVVADFHYSSLHEHIAPLAIRLNRPGAFSRISVRLASDQVFAAMDYVEKTWHKHFPNALYEPSFFDRRVEQQYKQDRQLSGLFLVFVVLSIFIACMGLFGLSVLSSEQRVKEVGMRKILGASVVHIVTLLTKEFIILVALAAVLAWPIAYMAMDHWLANFSYRVEIEWWMLVAAAGVALLIAISTVSMQALKTAYANPVEALRYE